MFSYDRETAALRDCLAQIPQLEMDPLRPELSITDPGNRLPARHLTSEIVEDVHQVQRRHA